LLALLMFGAALLALASTIGAAVSDNMLLLFLGAVPSSIRWVFVLPWAAVAIVVLMAVAAWEMWSGRRRSLPGRFYYLVLLLAGVTASVGFWKLGLLPALFG